MYVTIQINMFMKPEFYFSVDIRPEYINLSRPVLAQAISRMVVKEASYKPHSPFGIYDTRDEDGPVLSLNEIDAHVLLFFLGFKGDSNHVYIAEDPDEDDRQLRIRIENTNPARRKEIGLQLADILK